MKRLATISLALLFFSLAAAEEIQMEELLSTDESFFMVEPEKEEYSAGETVKCGFSMKNPFDFPIAEGDIRIYVYFVEFEWSQERYLVDKLELLEGLNIGKGEGIKYGFEWGTPKKNPPGFYFFEPELRIGKGVKLKDYLMEKEPIKVSGPGKIDFSIDKFNATLNGKRIFQDVPVDLKELLNIELGLKISNPSDSDSVVFIRYTVVREREETGIEIKEEIETKRELVKLKPRGMKDLRARFELPSQGEYELEIEGRTDNWQDRMEFKILSEGKEAGIVVAGLSEFPLEKGKGFEVFFCFDNYPKEHDMIEKAILIVESNGKEIARLQYEPEKPFERECIKKEFVATEDVAKADVNAVLESFRGETLDEVLIEYSSEKEPSTTPTPKITAPGREELQGNELTGIAIISAIIIVVLLILFSRKRKH